MAIFRIREHNDIAFVTNEEGLKELTLAVDLDYVRQKLKHRFLMLLGEYFADISLGFPYREFVLVNAPDLGLIRNLFRQTIQGSPGISQILSLTLEHDRRNRNLAVKFEAITTGGQFLSIDPRVDSDFVLSYKEIAATPPTRGQTSSNLRI